VTVGVAPPVTQLLVALAVVPLARPVGPQVILPAPRVER
jgi:hypothetical protein